VKAETTTTTTTGVLLEREAGEAATGFSTTRDADGDGGGFRGSSAPPETEEPAAVARKMYEHVAGAGRPVRREEPPRVVKSTTRFL
jgi:hypothetical protein